jgi:catechol 2,3-dioxygenase
LTVLKGDAMQCFLPERTHVTQAQLRCRDASRQVSFYHEVLGLKLLDAPAGEVRLAGKDKGRPILVLWEDKAALGLSGTVTGLFHLALRYANREALGRAYLRLAKTQYPLEGAADHLVSEAIYLRDPEGNGVELYADRPRSSWVWRDGQVMMATQALDLNELVLATRTANRAKDSFAGPDLGHIHLRVTDLERAERFYHDFLGLAVTTRAYPGALFFSAGGYHHHIAVNTWGSPQAALPNSAGLLSYRLSVPVREILYCLKHRAPLVGVDLDSEAQGTDPDILRLKDPNGNWLEVGVDSGG